MIHCLLLSSFNLFKYLHTIADKLMHTLNLIVSSSKFGVWIKPTVNSGFRTQLAYPSYIPSLVSRFLTTITISAKTFIFLLSYIELLLEIHQAPTIHMVEIHMGNWLISEIMTADFIISTLSECESRWKSENSFFSYVAFIRTHQRQIQKG